MALLLPTLLLAQMASGVRWDSLYSRPVRNSDGPPNITLQLSTRRDGKPGYRISIIEDDPFRLAGGKAFPDAVRFHRLTPHWTTQNDLYKDKRGRELKVFPHVVFVGQGRAAEKPVTYVWEAVPHYDHWTPEFALRVFDGDARHLDDPGHGSMRRGRYLVERARAAWLPTKDRPSWAKPSDRLARDWTYVSGKKPFSAGPWRRIP